MPSDVIVTAQIAPEGQLRREFGATLYLLEASAASTVEGARLNLGVNRYAGPSAVAADYGSSVSGAAEVNAAAATYFAQSPYPKPLFVAKWNKASQSSIFLGRSISLTTAQAQALATFTLTVDGATTGNIVLTAAANLAAAVTLIQTALNAAISGTTATLDGSRIKVTFPPNVDPTGGFTSGTNTNAAGALGLTGDGIEAVQGTAPESIDAALTRIEAADNGFYFVAVGDSIRDTDDAIAVANWCASRRYFAAIDSTETGALTANESTSKLADLHALAQENVFGFWSATADRKALSFAARFSSVNFGAANSLITGKFKSLPSTAPDDITDAQEAELVRKRVNFYRDYGTDSYTAEGHAFGAWIDARFWVDWFVDAVQAAVFNLLRQSPARVPQTPEGVAAIQDVIEGVCDEGVRNGGIAPGQLSPALTLDAATATGNGDFDGFLSLGYLVHFASIAGQSQADRNARKAPAGRVFVKGSGAIHSANIGIVFDN